MTVLPMPVLPTHGRSVDRTVHSAIAAVIAITTAGHAHAEEPDPEAGATPTAEDGTSECIAAHVEGQRLDRAGALRQAREALVRCSRPTCPSLLVQECATLLADVDAAIPTVVFALSDAEGRDIADARVLERGVVVASRLDGKAIAIDPGEHTFSFERAGSEPIAVTAVIREGDRGRRIGAVLQADGGSDAEDDLSIPPLSWAFGAVGVVGLGLFAGFGAGGLSARSDLDERSCKPSCPVADVDAARDLFLAADISLGVGLAGLVAATVIFIVDSPEQNRSVRLGLGAGRLAGGGDGVKIEAAW